MSSFHKRETFGTFLCRNGNSRVTLGGSHWLIFVPIKRFFFVHCIYGRLAEYEEHTQSLEGHFPAWSVEQISCKRLAKDDLEGNEKHPPTWDNYFSRKRILGLMWASPLVVIQFRHSWNSRPFCCVFLQLAPIKLSRYNEDLLFYLYYTNGGDILQLAAAAELWVLKSYFHRMIMFG